MTITDLHDLGGQVFECNKVRTTTARGVERRSSRTSQECGTDRPAKKGPFLAGVFATATQYSQNSSSPDQHADLPHPPLSSLPQYNRRFVNVVVGLGKKRSPNSNAA